MNRNTSFLLAASAILIMMGAGCSPATPSSSNSPSVPSATAPVATTHYINADLGLGFDYPTAWGAPKIDEESGQQNGKYNGCIYQRAVEFPELKGSGILLTAMSTKTCQAPGREGYWGDQASGLTAQGWTSKADCDSGSADVCDLFKTTSGESVWHQHYPKYEIPFSGEGDTVSINKYALYHTGHPLSGVMISDERLPENVDAQSVGDLLALVKSITFVAPLQAETDMTGWKTVITYPVNGSVIEGRDVKIKGTAKPNSYLWAFPSGGVERACIGSDLETGSFGGDGQTDANGNFEFALKEPCSKNIEIYVVSEDPGLGDPVSGNPNWVGICQSDSELVRFTLSGALPESCSK